MVDRSPWTPSRLLLLTVMCLNSFLARGFDVRRHLGTKTRYAYRLAVPGAPSIYKTPDPDGYEPVHLYLLARHGTRWPTGDRMRQINDLERLFKDARNTADHPWLRNWTAPFADVDLMGGELHAIGADELWGLAYRLRKRFPSLSGQDYLPKRFPVVSTQIARTAASASAFTSGFFHEVGSGDPSDDPHRVNPAPPGVPAHSASRALGGRLRGAGGAAPAASMGQAVGRSRSLLDQRAASARPPLLDDLDESLQETPTTRRPQAVAISMAPKAADPMLRFFEVCPAYAQHDEYTEKWISSWMQGNWSKLVPGLERRLDLSRDMSPCEVESLWQLCLMEGGLYGITGQACSLFEPEEALTLEWVDDIHLLETLSYGAPINYDIAAPLLRDAVETLKAAAGLGGAAAEASAARLLFAHCETLVPLASLLGLFRPSVPTPPDASPAQIAAAVSPAAAMRHLQQVDSVEDLQVVVERLQELNVRDRSASSSSTTTATSTRSLTSEDAQVCRKGRPVSPDAVPPPPGWYPMFPNDDSRLFKGARIAPFGSNMALVLYRRKQGGGAASGRPAFLVRLLYNEQVLPIPGCSSSGGGGDSSEDPADLECDLDRFLEVVQDKIHADALDKVCGVSTGNTSNGNGIKPSKLRIPGKGAGLAASAS